MTVNEESIGQAGFRGFATMSRRGNTRERRGGLLVLVAVSLVALMGFLVLAVDVGSLHGERRISQTAADAGALGGAAEIWE